MLRSLWFLALTPVAVPLGIHFILQIAAPPVDSTTVCIPWWTATAAVSGAAAVIGYLFKLLLSIWTKTDTRLDHALDRVAELENTIRLLGIVTRETHT